MKFLSLALAAALACASTVVEATRLAGKHTSDLKFTSKLMSKARRVEEAAAEEDFEITGAHMIIFKTCETLSVQADFGDGNDNTTLKIQELYEQGAVRAQHSYILFDVCLSDYCYSNNGSYRTTYVVDMADFIQTFAEFIPTKQANYCNACQEQTDYCESVFSGTQYGEAAADENADGGRKLQNNQGVVEYIDCSRCQSYGCYAYQDGEGENNNNNNGQDNALQWIQEMSECARDNENPYYFNGAAVSMGFMCNADGSGVEIATFLDEDCVLYTNQIAFGNIMSEQDYQYYYQSRQSIEYMFNTGFSCYDPEVTYTNPYDYVPEENAQDENADGEQQQEEQAPEASEWCRAIMEGGEMDPTPMSDCGGAQDGGRRQLDQGEQQGYYTTSYTLGEEYINDGYSVCMALNGFGGKGEHLYDKSGSGSMYQYSSNKKKSSSSNWQGDLDKHYSKSSTGGKKTGLIVFFVLAAMAAMGAGGFLYYKKKLAADEKKEPILGDSAKEDGTMA